MVPVRKIIAGNQMESWAMPPRGLDYINSLVQEIRAGRVTVNDLKLAREAGPSLREFGGAFDVSDDGRHRVIAAKILDLPEIAAKYRRVEVIEAYAEGWRDVIELVRRRALRLWRGSIRIDKDNTTLKKPYVVGDVTEHQGVWVFSKDMARVRKIYEEIGVSGKFED